MEITVPIFAWWGLLSFFVGFIVAITLALLVRFVISIFLGG